MQANLIRKINKSQGIQTTQEAKIKDEVHTERLIGRRILAKTRLHAGNSHKPSLFLSNITTKFSQKKYNRKIAN